MLINFEGNNQSLSDKLLIDNHLSRINKNQEYFLKTGDSRKGIEALMQLVSKGTLSDETFVVLYDRLDKSSRVYMNISASRDGKSQDYGLPENFLELLVYLECIKAPKNLKLIIKKNDASQAGIGTHDDFINYALIPVDIGQGKLAILGLVNFEGFTDSELGEYLLLFATRIGMMLKFEELVKINGPKGKTENYPLEMDMEGPSDAINIFDTDKYPVFISPVFKNMVVNEYWNLRNNCFFNEFQNIKKALKGKNENVTKKNFPWMEKANEEFVCLDPVNITIYDSSEEIETYLGNSRDSTAEEYIWESYRGDFQGGNEKGNNCSEFIYITAHEYKKALATIKSSIEICRMELKGDKTPGTEKFQKHFRRVNNEVDSMTRLLDGLLNLEKNNQGSLPLKNQKKNVNDCFEEMLEIWLERNQITLESKVPIGFQVDVDLEMAKLAVSNLVENAIKYGGNHAMPKVKLSLKKEKLVICVQDFGEGIPEREQKNVFKPFFRASNSKKYTNGTGLGLMIAKRFVELQNGNIYFKSIEGQGTKFYIEFPV